MFGFSMAGVCRVSEGCEATEPEKKDTTETDKKDSTGTTIIAQKMNFSNGANVRVSVYDMQGKLVANRVVSSDFEITNEVVSSWVKSAGMYRIVMREGSKLTNIPVVVK